MSGGYWYPLAGALLCAVGAHGCPKAGEAFKGTAPFPPAWSKVRCAWGISSAPKEDQFQIKAAVPFCQLKDSVSRRGKGFCVPLGLNLATGVWGNAALQEAKSRLSARGALHLCGKWHRAHSVLFQSPSCQECRGLQVTAQEERLGCEWMHEHGF